MARILIIGGSRSGKTNALRNLKKREDDDDSNKKYSNNTQDVYKNIEDYNSSKKCNVLIVFDDIIAHMISNKKLNAIATALFTRGRKLNISAVFITRSYSQLPNDVKLSSKQTRASLNCI